MFSIGQSSFVAAGVNHVFIDKSSERDLPVRCSSACSLF